MKIDFLSRLRCSAGFVLQLLLWFTLGQTTSAYGQPSTRPTLTSLSPTSGSVGTKFTLNGTNLTGTNTITFINASTFQYVTTGFTVNSAGTQIMGIGVPSTPPGTYNVRATVPSNGTSNDLVFSVTIPAPVISSFTPIFAKSGQTVTLIGSNLNGATALTFSGVTQPTFTVNAAGTQLTAAVPYTGAMSASPDLTSGLIQVTTPGGTAASATPLRLLAVTSATTSAGLSAYSGGLAGDNVTISGSGFTGANAAFSLNSVIYPVSYTVNNETQITAVVPDLSGSTAPGGSGGFIVTNTPGLSGANFEVLSPVISSLAPSSGPTGTVVTVTGFNFNRADSRVNPTAVTVITGLTFNGKAGTNFQLLSPTQARATVPAGATTGYVRTNGGSLQEGYSKGVAFTVAASAPTLTGITPGNGPAGTSLTLTGTNLEGTTAVAFVGTSGNVVATGFGVNAAGTQITGVVVPAGAQTGPVTATTLGGTSNGIAFTVEPCPVATVAYGAPSYCRSGANPTPTMTGPTGGTFSAPAGLSLDPATGVITLGSSTPGTYTVSYAAGTPACPTRATAQVSVTVPPVATFAYGATSYCLNATSAIPAVLAPNATAGAFTATPAGLNLNAATGAISLTGSQPGTYTVTNTVAPGGGCAAVAATSTVMLNAVPDATLTTSTPTTFCAGGSVVLSAGGGAASATYQFQRNGTPIPGATAVSYIASTGGTYTVAVTNPMGCTATSASVNVTVNPATTATFAYGSATFCQSGTNPVPTVTGTTGGVFSAGTGLSLNGTTGAVNLTASTLGTYTVTYSVSGSCPSTATATLTVTRAPLASFSYANAAYCVGGAVNPAPVFAAGTSAGNFTASPAGLALNAATGMLNLATSADGTYTVTNSIAASGGCAAALATAQVVLNAAPTATLTAGAPTTFCQGGSVMLTAPAAAGYTYQFQRDGVDLTGATATTYAALVGGAYTVVVTNGSGCSATSPATSVMVNPLPPQPILSANYNGSMTTLRSSAATGNQFYLNRVAIAGATAQTYVVITSTQLGAYTVVVTAPTGCASAASAPITVTSSLKPLAGTSLRVYPNPTPDGRLQVELVGYRQAVELSVLNALGQVVHRVLVPAAASDTVLPIDMTQLASGFYLLRAKTTGGLDTRRMVKN